MRWAVAVLACLASCGRFGLDTPANAVGGGDGGGPGPDGAGPSDGHGTAQCAHPTTGTCASLPFTRVQFVPANCAVGTACMILQQTAAQAQSITLTQGDLLVAFAYGGQNPNGSAGGTAPNMTFTVTDTLGNAFFAGPFVNNAKYDDSAIQMFYAPDVKGGADNVTATSSAPQAETFWTGLVVIEYRGVATTEVVDFATSNAGPIDASTVFAPALTARTECDLVVGGMTNGHVDNSQDTPGQGWAMPVLDEWDPAGFVDATGGTSLGDTASIAIQQARGADDGWAATQMAFRAATATPPCEPSELSFTTTAQGLPANTCSGPTTLTSLDAGSATTTPSGIAVTLAADAGTTFYADAGCQFPITSTLIGAGTSATTFWFESTSATPPTLTASATGFADATQAEAN